MKSTVTREIPKATGDCYEAAFLYMFEHRDHSHMCLVHGEVAGQGPLEGMTLGHGWVEDGPLVIDRSNGRNILLPKWKYYKIGKILELNNIHRYTFRDAAQKVLDSGHYGPWDLEVAQ